MRTDHPRNHIAIRHNTPHAWVRLAALACGLLFGVAGDSFGQETTGSLEGRVLDPAGNPVDQATVTLTGSDLQGSRSVSTLDNGFFRFPALPVGRYSATVTHVSYRVVTFEDVRVRLGQTTNLGDVRLEDMVYAMEPLVVTATPPRIDPRSTYTGYNLSSEEFENLPIDRDYSTMATLLPYVNRGYEGDVGSNGVEFSGSTDFENNYFIDGVEATEPYWGAGGISLPYNFVQEVQVRAGGYEAEYRSALGGVVDVITHSGSNEFHGSVFGHYIDHNLTGSDRLSVGAAPKGDFGRYDFGVGIGGPVVKDRLWYYTAFDMNHVTEDATIPGLEVRPDVTNAYRFAGKLDWKVDERNDLSFCVIGAPSNRDMVWTWAESFYTPVKVLDADVYLLNQKYRPFVFSLQGRHALGQNLLIESSASLFKWKYEEIPANESGTAEPMFIDAETGTWSGGYIGSLVNDFRTEAFDVTGTLLTGNHTWKAGLEYREIFGYQGGDGGYITRTVDQTDGSESFFWFRFLTLDDTPTKNRLPSAFAQDSWRLGKRLRLNLGLRWDGQYIVDTNGHVAQTILDQWQPRTGFTYRPGENDDQKVYGSFGRFYQELGAVAADARYREDAVLYGGYVFDTDPRLDPSGADTVWESGSTIQDKVDGLKGQYFDEFTLGYERALGRHGKAGVRGVYRTLRRAIENGFDPDTGEEIFGNPGFGAFSDFPKARREYSALELTYQLSSGNKFGVLASYVLSRNYGNYPGLFATDYHQSYPNLTLDFDFVESTKYSTGLLPNDRPHALKLSGWYRTHIGLMAGMAASWVSGAPLNEFGAVSMDNPENNVFLVPRGKAGRAPSLWDLSFRFSYDVPVRTKTSVHPRVILDLLHVGSPRRAVAFDQKHYFGVDDNGNPTSENPTYGQPTRYQPPMAVRLGAQVGF